MNDIAELDFNDWVSHLSSCPELITLLTVCSGSFQIYAIKP